MYIIHACGTGILTENLTPAVKLVRTKSAPSVSLSKPDILRRSRLDSDNLSFGKSSKETDGSVLPEQGKSSSLMMTSRKQRKESQEPNDSKDQSQQSLAPPRLSIPKSASTSRRNSWISSLSSKFSSGSAAPSSQNPLKDAAGNTKTSPQGPRVDNPSGAASSPKEKDEKREDPFTAQSPKSQPSFLHNAFRKFSGGSTLGKVPQQGVVCERRVMNIDPNRDRCKVPELDSAKLRRVAFCVDVEIAGTSRRSESEEEEATQSSRPKSSSTLDKMLKKTDSKSTDSKSADKGEGTALKSPQKVADQADSPPATDSGSSSAETSETSKDSEKRHEKESTRKQEKKKKSEGERKERKERKRRQAEADGMVPLQFPQENGSGSTNRSPKGQSQPTTDPIRIYRRCCQLRESSALKKLVEEMSAPSSTLAESPGTVAVLDLTGLSMSLPDIVTFSDWLAIVPVRKLILQDCDLTDEGVRIILAGLLSTKTMEESRRRTRSKSVTDQPNLSGTGSFGAIERLSLKGNPRIGHEGWRHIGLFIHLSRSLKAIDLSGIPFPSTPFAKNGPPSPSTSHDQSVTHISTVFANALSERLAGSHLEELVINECCPTADDMGKICRAAKAINLRRLGVANNKLAQDGFEHVVDYFRAGYCEGLDLGGNDLKDHSATLASAIQKGHPLSTLSLADSSLAPKSLCVLLQALVKLQNFRFIDMSHNPALFTSQPDSLAVLRRYLPQMPELRRLHLVDVGLSSNHAISLAEILPDCRKICHINIMENYSIQSLAAANDAASQEEACALYASLMTAARISRTLIAVDIEVPSAENNEVVKALASQIVAYSLNNLERGELVEGFPPSPDAKTIEKDVPIPDVLLRIVGDSTADAQESVGTEHPPDENYVIGGTGVVKALGVCLGNADQNSEGSIDMSPTPSGASTPLRHSNVNIINKRQPRDMSKDLLNSARRIRVRLQPALVREDRAGNDANYRKLICDVSLLVLT